MGAVSAAPVFTMNCEILNRALSQFGIKEIVGKKDNPEVLKYFDEVGFDGKSLKDETAWCSAFMNWVAKTTGHEHTEMLNARSWLNVGEKIKAPQLGDVIILWRESPSSWKGHVGIYIREDESMYWVLGGNQRNMVGIHGYSKQRLLGFRRLNKI